MKYIVIIICMLGISPISIGAVNPEFKQQIRAITQCNDGIDNDGDGLLDFASDPDCVSWEDTNESTEIQPTPEPSPQPNPQPSPEPRPEPQPEPNSVPDPTPIPEPTTPSIPEKNNPKPIDYIDIINSIEYTIDTPTTGQSNIVQQSDTFEDRTRLDSIFSVMMMGVLSLGLWLKDFFLKLIP